MATMWIVPARRELEDRHARLDLETLAVEQLAFKRGEKGFAQRIIEAVAYRAHRGPYTGLLAALAEGQ